MAGLAASVADRRWAQQVAVEAKRLGLWLNVADRPEEGNFHVPAVHRQPGLVVGVSTGNELREIVYSSSSPYQDKPLTIYIDDLITGLTTYAGQEPAELRSLVRAEGGLLSVGAPQHAALRSPLE